MKRTFIAGLTCLVLLSAGLVHAGIIDDIEVEIWTDSNGYQNAHGVMRSARNSADSVQYLGCNRTAYKSGSEQTFCYARNTAGTFVGCLATSPSMQRIAESTGPASYLEFTINPDGTCNRLKVVNSSTMM